jgi:hypothetical protein
VITFAARVRPGHRRRHPGLSTLGEPLRTRLLGGLIHIDVKNSAASPTMAAGSPRPRRTPRTQTRPGLRLRLHRDRRPLPAGLRRDSTTTRKARPARPSLHVQRGSTPVTGSSSNAWSAQRQELPAIPRLPRHRSRARDPAEVHQTPLPLDQRQSRAPQPDPGDRTGLRPPLRHQ